MFIGGDCVHMVSLWKGNLYRAKHMDGCCSVQVHTEPPTISVWLMRYDMVNIFVLRGKRVKNNWVVKTVY